ncbi:MAG: hypothetical protein KAG97_02895 [Victivallales bacterium]|nr:hypothetical protein [Victivallales bacterium]
MNQEQIDKLRKRKVEADEAEHRELFDSICENAVMRKELCGLPKANNESPLKTCVFSYCAFATALALIVIAVAMFFAKKHNPARQSIIPRCAKNEIAEPFKEEEENDLSALPPAKVKAPRPAQPKMVFTRAQLNSMPPGVRAEMNSK